MTLQWCKVSVSQKSMSSYPCIRACSSISWLCVAEESTESLIHPNPICIALLFIVLSRFPDRLSVCDCFVPINQRVVDIALHTQSNFLYYILYGPSDSDWFRLCICSAFAYISSVSSRGYCGFPLEGSPNIFWHKNLSRITHIHRNSSSRVLPLHLFPRIHSGVQLRHALRSQPYWCNGN
jgi:hypothetical protein